MYEERNKIVLLGWTDSQIPTEIKTIVPHPPQQLWQINQWNKVSKYKKLVSSKKKSTKNYKHERGKPDYNIY